MTPERPPGGAGELWAMIRKSGMTALEGGEAGPLPITFRAVTVNV